MATKIYHLEMTMKNGERETTHSYYTSLVGLYEDNENLNVSLSWLQKQKFPITYSEHYWDWIIRKGIAHTKAEIQEYNKAIEKLDPKDFE